MVIQVLEDSKHKPDTAMFKYNLLSSPKSLDEFDINIINLSSPTFWHNKGDKRDSINATSDLINLEVMIDKSKLTKIIIIFPQNCPYNYFYQRKTNTLSYYYSKTTELKFMSGNINIILGPLVGRYSPSLIYENTTTLIGEYELAANFYFDSNECITESTKSKKCTTVIHNDIILTTLQLDNAEKMVAFLKYIGLLTEGTEMPEWAKSLNYFDDEERRKIISEKEYEISIAKDVINESQGVLVKNNRYKSILYTNGSELVEVVFDILSQIFDYDLSGFIDKKEEDFIIKLQDITFIGEIKGVNSNVRFEHISQLDVHLHRYLDSMESDSEEVKALIIINHQRSKPLTEREEINIKQIELAKRNGSLIIETNSLLKLFEDFRKGQITTKQIKELFISSTGILNIDG